MIAAIAVDIGNTRIKWGRCLKDSVLDMASLPPDDETAWEAQWRAWCLTATTPWIAAGVHPDRLANLARWLARKHITPMILSWKDLPVKTDVDHPDRTGIDRLVNAVAANKKRLPNQACIIVDAGSAVTVDWIDRTGTFRGGAILPGFRLMSEALHAYTAKLPKVHMDRFVALPGRNTIDAILAGIGNAVVGAIERMEKEYRVGHVDCARFLTGGDSALLAQKLGAWSLWPAMTLEGILLASPFGEMLRD